MDDLDLGATIKGYIPGQKLFRRYTLTRILGRGGMGIVWLARDEELGRDTALKFLPEVVATDRSALDDLKREVRRAIDLAHPHIVKIHDFVTDGRTAAVSMEYVQGDTLSSLRVDQPERVFTTAQLTPWVAQLCSALQYAHGRAQVVHRDLKPANLMVDTHGELKVLDFGIAASLSESVTRVSKQAGSSGTPVYMSPQQMMGEKPAVTDDLYALGATLYELLTGKPPFYAGNIMMQVQNKLPPTMTERRSEFGVTGEPIPPEWEATIAACLAKEPKDRPQSASEVLERLGGGDGHKKAQKAAKTDSAKPEAPVPKSVPDSAIRNPRSALAKLALAAGVVLLAAAGWYFGLHAPEQRRIETERLRVGQTRIATEQERAAAERARQEAQARSAQTFENTLGMKFVPVPGTNVLFSVWETRVQDFEAFVRETGHDATQGMHSDRGDGWKQQGDTWRSPGFPQGPTHPVVGLNQADAKAFCEWLTKRERAAGRLETNQSYRLPTDAEWDAAVGRAEFPWGNQWPPPRGAGNYADEAAKRGRYKSWTIISGYDDGYDATAPVGSFTANTHGIYDLGGNVWEYVDDRAHGVRGASFNDFGRGVLASSGRLTVDYRSSYLGFRVVCAVGSVR